MNKRTYLRALLGCATAAVTGALLVALYFFVMFGFDFQAFAIALRALLYTIPAALIGLPLYLLLNLQWHGHERASLSVAGAIAGAVLAALVTWRAIDITFCVMAALVGVVSGFLAHPIAMALTGSLERRARR